MSSLAVRGQSEAQISQYMFSLESYNSAYVGVIKEINLFGLHRQQWMGMPNAPQTTYFSGSAPLRVLNKTYGVGLIFYNDNAGIFSTQSVNAQLAYDFPLYDGKLSVGGDLGFINQTINGDSVRQITSESEYHDIEGDVFIPKQMVNGVAFDMSLGALYRYRTFDLGLSVKHLFQPTIVLDDYAETFVGRVAYLYSAYEMTMTNSRYKLTPSVLAKTDFIVWQTDVSLKLERDERYWGGLSWRYQEAVVFFFGVNMLQGLNLGCSYDLQTTQMFSNTAGSYDVFLRYKFSVGKKKNNKYKSVRIL